MPQPPEAVGAKDSEAERWQRELRMKEEQVAFEQDTLGAQAAQLAEMQAELAEKRRQLEERDRQLRHERQAKEQLEQLLSEGSLAEKVLGVQRSGTHRVLLHGINFSQDSIKATFRDGRSIEETIKDLWQGKQKPADLPTIHVVEFPKLGKIWSLDNRRLRCLQKAFPLPQNKTMKIDVEVMPLSNPKVQEEFRRKWTAGGSIQVR